MAVISSPLAKSLQGGLVQRVSGSTFGGGRGIGPVSSPDVSSERNETLLENNTETLSSISASLTLISTEIRSIRDGINSIGERLASEASLEQAAARADAEYQKRLAERQVRATGEQELENKIQLALSEPVKRVQNKVQSVFGRVMDALGALFLGWLTNQGIEAIKAYSEGNVEKLREIAFNVTKTFGFLVGAAGAFSLLKAGIFRVLGAMSSLAGRVGKFVISGLFVRPFEILINAIKRRWAGVRGAGPPRAPTPTPGAPGSPGGPKGPKGKGPGIFGAGWAAIESFMNLKNGEYVDAVMPIVAAFGPGKFVKGLVAAGYAADQIAEIFGSNIFGKDPNKERQAKEVAEEAKKESTPQAQTTPVAQAQTPMMGEKKETAGLPSTPMMGETTDAAQVQISGAAVPAGMEGSASTPAVTPQTPKTPDASSLSLGSGSSFGVDTTGLKGPDSPLATDKKGDISSEPKAAEVTPTPTYANAKMESLGPEPKTPTTVIAQVPSAPQKQQALPPPAAGTDVPTIRSANPDNFYALYSQFNYNVVI